MKHSMICKYSTESGLPQLIPRAVLPHFHPTLKIYLSNNFAKKTMEISDNSPGNLSQPRYCLCKDHLPLTSVITGVHFSAK